MPAEENPLMSALPHCWASSAAAAPVSTPSEGPADGQSMAPPSLLGTLSTETDVFHGPSLLPERTCRMGHQQSSEQKNCERQEAMEGTHTAVCS
jgi:hypothetical protein